MKKFALLLIGCIPFLIGWFIDRFLIHFIAGAFPLFIVGILLLAVWFASAYFLGQGAGGTVWTAVLLNLPALLILVLVGVQELALHAYWRNFVGIWTQIFYLPLLHIGFTLSTWSHRVFTAYCIGFVLLAAASLLGCHTYKKRAYQKRYS